MIRDQHGNEYKNESGYCYSSIDAIPRIIEIDTFEDALKQNAKYRGTLQRHLQIIQKAFDRAKTREVELQVAISEGILQSPSELMKHKETLAFQAEITKRKESAAIVKIEALRLYITNNWKYVLRCNKYINNPYDDIDCDNNNDNSDYDNNDDSNDDCDDFSINDILEDECGLEVYKENMTSKIIRAHKLHNKKLRMTHKTKCHVCSDNECVAMCENYRTTICHTKIYWEMDYVNWLEDLNLDADRPVGYFVYDQAFY